MIGNDVAHAARLLEQGKLVAIPTETVYGLAGNALEINAIGEIYRVKNRPSFNPLILHVPNLETAQKYVTHFPKEALKLARQFWPGSLSILLPKSELVQDIVTAGSSHVVVRVPNHPMTLKLLDSIDFPLVAPSANISNTVSPTSADHVQNGIGNQIDYILDGGQMPQLELKVPSYPLKMVKFKSFVKVEYPKKKSSKCQGFLFLESTKKSSSNPWATEKALCYPKTLTHC